MSNLVIKE